MSGPDQVKRFGGALLKLFVDGELPSDDTPFLEGEDLPAGYDPPGPRSLARARDLRPCPRCRGDGEVLFRGVIIPCDEDGCEFRKAGK